MDIGYVAVETFITTQKYRDWSKLYHVKEVISLDGCLCTSIIQNLTIDDYTHVLWMDNDWTFRDLDWLQHRVHGIVNFQILAVTREPISDCSNYTVDESFHFYGYDLLDCRGGISALTNCGGFDKAFHPSDISQFGLIDEFDKAKVVQQKLLENYPDEHHAACATWAIWRMEKR